jgi:hypothetical protein
MISKRRSHPEWCAGSQDPVDRPSRARQLPPIVGATGPRRGPVAPDAQPVQPDGAVAGRFAVAPFGSPRYVAYAETAVLPSLRARWM